MWSPPARQFIARLIAVALYTSPSLAADLTATELRWLEGGLSIWTSETDLETTGIDTPDDLEKVVHLFSDKK